MRGAFLMSLFAICAALSLHYLRAAAETRSPDASRSDPLISMEHAFPLAREHEVADAGSGELAANGK